MRKTLSRFIVLSLLIFAVLEKSGVSVISFLFEDSSPAFGMILSDNDPNAKEAENTKEVSAKEIWVSDMQKNALSPVCRYLFRQPAVSRDFTFVPFYPSTPTPPPNHS